MDWSAILKVAGPILVNVLASAIGSFHAPTQPAPPVPADSAPAGTVASPDQFIKDIQALLNALAAKGFISLPKPLVVDGWLGDLTRQAGELAISKIRQLVGV